MYTPRFESKRRNNNTYKEHAFGSSKRVKLSFVNKENSFSNLFLIPGNKEWPPENTMLLNSSGWMEISHFFID